MNRLLKSALTHQRFTFPRCLFSVLTSDEFLLGALHQGLQCRFSRELAGGFASELECFFELLPLNEFRDTHRGACDLFGPLQMLPLRLDPAPELDRKSTRL